MLRDGRDNFIAAECMFIDRGLDVVSLEALAMRDGLRLANSLGFHNVEAESDSSQVIEFCSGQTQWWDAAAAIFTECVDISNSIRRVKFRHCPRTANTAAHELANYSYCNRNSISWINDPSRWLLGCLVDDLPCN